MLAFFHYHLKVIPHYIYFFSSIWVIQIPITFTFFLLLIIVNCVTSEILIYLSFHIVLTALFNLAYKFKIVIQNTQSHMRIGV